MKDLSKAEPQLDRRERLSRALRDNLRRRKLQARGRESSDGDPSPDGATASRDDPETI
jgi:hypothetical protein